MREIIKEFFRLLWPSVPPASYLTIWCLPNRQSRHFLAAPDHPATTEAIDYIVDCDAQRVGTDHQQVYYGVGLRGRDLKAKVLGSENEVFAWPGVWIDVDLAAPAAHASETLPPSIEAVDEVMRDFPLRPTLGVHSGYGLHLYYLYDAPLFTPTDRRRMEAGQLTEEAVRQKKLLLSTQLRLRQLFEIRGWHLDNTAKNQQVIRVPGTHNYKVPEDPQEVQIFIDDGPRYPIETIESAVVRGRGRPKAPPRPAADTPAPKTGTGTQSPGAVGGGSGLPSEVGGGSGFAETPTPNESDSSDDTPLWVREVRRRVKKLTNDANRQLAQFVLKGEPFAQPGSRNETCNKVVNIFVALAYKVCRRPEWQHTLEPSDIYEWFLRESVDAMAAESNDRANPALSDTDVIDQIRRGLGDIEQQEEYKKVAEDSLRKRLSEIASRNGRVGPRARPIPTIATPTNGHAVDTPPAWPPVPEDPRKARIREEDALRWLIIQHKTAYFVMKDGVYRKAVSKDELEVKLRDDFAEESGVDWTYEDANGNVKVKKLPKILQDYATVARELVYDLTINESHYNAEDETFHRAVAPIRDLESEFNPQIHEWLHHFGGASSEQLIDWLATVIDLDRQTCALYASGPGSTGKTLLGDGLARLWRQHGGPTQLAQALSNFNTDIMSCPLIVADEHIAGKRNSAELRTIVGSSSRTITEKFMPNATLRGALRLMLFANNDRMLLFGDEDLDSTDLEAIASRFLHIRTPYAAKEYLEKIGGRSQTEKWVDGDLIAKHVLWLRDNLRKDFQPGRRFLVEGHKTDVHKALLTQGLTQGLVIEWLARFLHKPLPIIMQHRGVLMGGGELLVNTSAITDNWEQYVTSHKVPSTQRVGRALRNLSLGLSEAKYVKDKSYWLVDHDLVLSWAKEFRLGNPEQMLEKIKNPAGVETTH